MTDHWQLQEAKQRFSELVRTATTEGPQFVTRHGEEVVVVVSVEDYRKDRSIPEYDFKSFLREGFDFDDLDLTRSGEITRTIDLDADE
jgi:prevent-host-death family protein